MAPSSRPARAATLFVPCYVDQLRPQAGIAAVTILESLGYRIDAPSDVLCCGQPFTNSGCAREGEMATEVWYRKMASRGPVVVLSSSCAVHLRHERPAAAEGPEIYEFCELLARHHADELRGRLDRRVCLHSSCHGIRDSRADAAARLVLGKVADLEVVQAVRSDECCGFGGSFSASFPELSVKMGRERLQDIETTETEEIVATDVSCLLHLEGIARAERVAPPLRFRHIAELLSDAAVAGAR